MGNLTLHCYFIESNFKSNLQVFRSFRHLSQEGIIFIYMIQNGLQEDKYKL